MAAFLAACLVAACICLCVQYMRTEKVAAAAAGQAREAVVRQLSHDIRSPLAALETILDRASSFSLQDRALITAAAARMRDIANTLAPNSAPHTEASAEPLLLEMEYAVSQVRQQLRQNGLQGIDLYLDTAAFSSAFTRASRSALRDALAERVEHSTANGPTRQELVVRCEGEHVVVSNETSGHTHTFAPQPAAPAPWFVTSLTWPAAGTVVVTDDDEAVHAAWHTRLNALPPQQAPRLLHLKTLEELAQHVRGLPPQEAAKTVYWIDCEFAGSRATGLDAIESLQLGPRSVLVTSHYDDPATRARCVAAGAKLMPKTLLHNVPLRQRAEATVVLIDDDTLVHQIWHMAAQGQGQGLAAYLHPDAFLQALQDYARSTPIYIDSQLGNGLRGEDIAKTVRASGFEAVYLTTGRDPGSFPPMPWVTAIVGKEPPF